MADIRVLIVDDSFFMRKVIADFLEADPDITVVGEATDGADALKKIAELRPQVVTLDIEMPIMNGLETLRAITGTPDYPAVVMVSGYVKKGADITLQCLAMGATDFVMKPSGSFSLDMDKIRESLIKKVKIAALANPPKQTYREPEQPRTWHFRTNDAGAVIIGASTGGPVALETLLPQFPKNFPYPIVVAQHLPGNFTKTFIERLRKVCELDVTRAEDGAPVAAGSIYIAAGGTATAIEGHAGSAHFRVQPNTQDIETPPVSPLMTSASQVYGAHTIGIILTGMGSDGASGMEHIKKAGGWTVVQDEASSAIFGMGREVIEKGLADSVVPLKGIAQGVSERLMHHE